MNKIFTFLIIAFCIKSSVAQDTLRSFDFPNPGGIYVISVGEAFTGMDPTTTGVNHSWDYSQLERNSQHIDTIYQPSATNPLLSFFFINSPLNSNRANLAAKDRNFNLGIIGLTNIFNYYYNSSASFTQPGFGAVIDSIPVPIAYSPHDVLYNFPLTYGDEDSVSYSYAVDLSSTIGIYYQVNRTRHNTVDGWGVLTTPFGIFDVLRVKTMFVEQDSIYVDTFHLGVKTPPVTTFEYKWLSHGFGLPVLQINTNDSNDVTLISYQDSVELTTVHELPSIAGDVVLFPNPANENVVVKYNLMKMGEVEFNLFDVDGKQIFTITDEKNYTGDNFKPIDLSIYKLRAGNYFLNIKSGNTSITKPLQIAR